MHFCCKHLFPLIFSSRVTKQEGTNGAMTIFFQVWFHCSEFAHSMLLSFSFYFSFNSSVTKQSIIIRMFDQYIAITEMDNKCLDYKDFTSCTIVANQVET